MTDELKACPFCGCSARKMLPIVDDGVHWIRCTGCDATGPTNTKYSGCNGELTFDWNSRADQPQAVGMVDIEMILRDTMTVGVGSTDGMRQTYVDGISEAAAHIRQALSAETHTDRGEKP